MSALPPEVEASIEELSKHYAGFERMDRGANGFLFFAKNKITDDPIAIKYYAGAGGEARHDEPRQLSAVRSRNVLPILDSRNVSDEWGYFITPRCFEGDVDDLIRAGVSAHQAVDTALGICNGLSAIHSANMLHRDLKPANIVLLKGAPQIADFGSVRALESGSDSVSASQHSLLYRPPESFVSGTYNMKGDIYQLGVVTFQLLGGSVPYDADEYLSAKQRKEYALIKDHADQCIFVNRAIEEKAKRGTLFDLSTLPVWINGAARRALSSMITADPGKRMSTSGDVAAALTQIRAVLRDWRWEGDIAWVQEAGRTIQLRPTDSPCNFEAFLSPRDGAPFRRAPGVPAGSIGTLLKDRRLS